MRNIVPLILFVGAMMVQNAIITRLNMLYGAADLMMLVLLSWALHTNAGKNWRWGVVVGLLVGVASAIPFWLPVIGYVVLVSAVDFVQQKLWEVPIWLLLISTFVGSFFIYGIEVVYLWISGVPLDLVEVINIVILPSLVLNMLMVLPVYGFVGEVAKTVYPREVEI
ncbi:hypothetical protein KQH54_04035 [bacterium]|nr:hypothetical protein [bacterium]